MIKWNISNILFDNIDIVYEDKFFKSDIRSITWINNIVREMTKFAEIIKQVTSNKILLESTFTVDSTPITSIKHYKDKLYYFPIINQAKTLVNFCPHSYNVWIPKEGRGIFPPVMGSAVTYIRDQVSVFHTSKDRLDNPGGWATSKGGMIHEFWHIISGRIHNIDSSYMLPTNHVPHPDYPALFDHVPYNLL